MKISNSYIRPTGNWFTIVALITSLSVGNSYLTFPAMADSMASPDLTIAVLETGGVHPRFDHVLNRPSLDNDAGDKKGSKRTNQNERIRPLAHALDVVPEGSNIELTHVLLIGPGSREVIVSQSSGATAKTASPSEKVGMAPVMIQVAKQTEELIAQQAKQIAKEEAQQAKQTTAREGEQQAKEQEMQQEKQEMQQEQQIIAQQAQEALRATSTVISQTETIAGTLSQSKNAAASDMQSKVSLVRGAAEPMDSEVQSSPLNGNAQSVDKEESTLARDSFKPQVFKQPVLFPDSLENATFRMPQIWTPHAELWGIHSSPNLTDEKGGFNLSTIMAEIGSLKNQESQTEMAQHQANIAAIKEQAGATINEAGTTMEGAKTMLTGAATGLAAGVATAGMSMGGLKNASQAGRQEEVQDEKTNQMELDEKTNQMELDKSRIAKEEVLKRVVKERHSSPLPSQWKSVWIPISTKIAIREKISENPSETSKDSAMLSKNDLEQATEYTIGNGTAYVFNRIPMTLHTSVADIIVPPKDGAFAIAVGNNVAVYNLAGGGTVKVKIGTNNVIPLIHGNQLVLTKNTSGQYEEVNPGKDISSTNVRLIGTYGGVKVFRANFNYPSTMDNLPQLGTLLGSKSGHELAIGKQLLQVTDVESMLSPASQ